MTVLYTGWPDQGRGRKFEFLERDRKIYISSSSNSEECADEIWVGKNVYDKALKIQY